MSFNFKDRKKHLIFIESFHNSRTIMLPQAEKIIFKQYLLFFYFILYILLGLFIYGDYGISWDEPISRMNGLVNLKYISDFLPSSIITDSIHNLPDLHL